MKVYKLKRTTLTDQRNHTKIKNTIFIKPEAHRTQEQTPVENIEYTQEGCSRHLHDGRSLKKQSRER